MSLIGSLSRFVLPEVKDRVAHLELGFNGHGVDRFGLSRPHLEIFYSLLAAFYRSYFHVRVHGIQNVPLRGRAMLVGNHSGGIAFDGAMVATAMLLDLPQPRIAHAMSEKFLNGFPISSIWINRVGHLTGLPEHAVRLLEDDRLLLVFPEGARGTAKLYRDRHSLVRFGTGFMRLALQTGTPIIPVATLGGGEAVPTVTNLHGLAKLVGAPYIPVTPWVLPVPIPARFDLHFGEPMLFTGTGREEDEVIDRYVGQVKDKLAGLIDAGRRLR